jgi:hypothetical protein
MRKYLLKGIVKRVADEVEEEPVEEVDLDWQLGLMQTYPAKPYTPPEVGGELLRPPPQSLEFPVCKRI